MFSSFEDQLIDDATQRVEQSRVSYNLQTEEFRSLNRNLQTYLGDIKTIDDNNHKLQENIEQIRTEYIITLENNLKRLPKDFRVQSQILNDVHFERYKFKSRTRRFMCEREEYKRRINFVSKNEKDQIKQLNILQKHERIVRNEFLKLNEELQRLLKYVETEKQIHQQAMDKVDDLQIEFEQKCIERSKVEFEIQSLKEEVKLMQTTKEFLNDEYETIISSQTEANEYLLSHLNDSITRIREDFDQLNKSQLQQTENEYKQIIQKLEENFLTNQTTNISRQTISFDHERLENEHQSSLQQLTILVDQNRTLSEQVLAMEQDLHSLRNERMQQLVSKDNELDISKMELQTLNEKLNNLAEYDRNLKFELTLYRGVLESEYRRKQSASNVPHLVRPTTLRTNKDSMTDRTTWLTNNTNQNRYNDQQQEEILTTRNRVQSDYDPVDEDTNGQINRVISTKTPSNDETFISDESLWEQLIEPFKHEQQKDGGSPNIIIQDGEKPSNSLSTAFFTEDESTLLYEAQPSASRTSSVSTGTRKSPTSSTPPILREEQSPSSQGRKLPTIPPELRSLSTISPTNQVTSPINTIPFAFEDHQTSSTFPQEYQTLSGVQQESSSRTSSINAGTSAEAQKSPSSSVAPIIPADQPTSSEVQESPSVPLQEPQLSSRTSSISTGTSSEVQKSSSSSTAPTVLVNPLASFQYDHSSSAPLQEHQPSSRTSSISTGTSSEVQKSPSLSIAPLISDNQTASSEVQESPSIPPQESQLSSRTSSISTGTSSEVQKSSSSIAPIIPDDQPTSSEVQESPSIPLQEPQLSSRTSSISTGTSSEVQKSPSLSTAPLISDNQTTSSEVQELASAPPQEPQLSSRTSSISTGTSSEVQKSPSSSIAPIIPNDQPTSSEVQESPSVPLQEPQLSSRTSSISTGASSEVQKSLSSSIAPTVLEDQLASFQFDQSPSAPLQEYQPSSRTSSIGVRTPSDIQKSPLLATTPTVPEYQAPSTPPQEHQPSSRTSSIDSKASSDIQKSPTIATTPIAPEYQSPTSDVHQSSSTPLQEYQPSSRTSSISSKTSLDFQKAPTTAIIPTVPQYQSLISDFHQSSSTPPEDRQTLSEFSISPKTNADIQGKTSSITADDYRITTSIDEFGNENQLTKSFAETDDNFQFEESVSYTTDDKEISEVDHNERRQSMQSIEQSSAKEFEVSFQAKSNESQSLSLTDTPQEEREQDLSQLDTNISSEFKLDETSDQNDREENINSSLTNQTEENNSTHNISSGITNDPNLNEFSCLLPQHTSKQSSQYTSLTDIDEVDYATSQKLEIKSDDDDDPNLAAIIQDLLYAFHDLANDEDLVEIDNDLPDRIFDRLEFRDHVIRTLFDSLIRKYLVQPAMESTRSEKLDWVEFRDILFPIITGRYTERHIRKLFDLFDTSRDGYLSLQEIAELLEVLHANDTIYLAQNIIDEFDTDHDGKLNVDELIDAIKKTEDINEHALSEETENKQWFNQSPIENETISLEVPIINFSSKLDDQFSGKISLLGRIFKRVGADFDSKQLDSNNRNLSMQITNEFINNNINISSDNLQLFVQLFLDKKQQTDSLINWIEFRDTFFPIINNGYYTKNHIKTWFEIFDTDQNGIITQQQLIQLLHLLRIQNSEEIIDKLTEITDSNDSWTFDELIFVLDNVDETASHLLTNNEQITSFDINWLSNNVF